MNDYSELKRLAEDAQTFAGLNDEVSPAQDDFIAAANPAAVLALIAGFDCLIRGAESLNGVLTITDRDRVETLMELRKCQAERDQLKAEVESLRGSCKAMGKDMAKFTRERNSARSQASKLQAEVETLRKSVPCTWCAVADTHPPAGEQVLIFLNFSEAQEVAIFEKADEFFMADHFVYGDHLYLDAVHVSHWMPLPSAPEAGQ